MGLLVGSLGLSCGGIDSRDSYALSRTLFVVAWVFLTRGHARLRALTQDLLPAFHTESVGAVVPGVSLGDTNVVRRAGERLGRSNVRRSRVLRFGKLCVGLLTS